MSLTKCPHCKHHNSVMRIYLAMNLKHRCVGEITRCEKCRKKMVVHRKYTSIFQRILSGIIWLLPAVVLIALVALHIIDYRIAIFLIIMFHIVSFWVIIQFGNYSHTKK